MRRGVEVLDQDYFVADFVVDQFVHCSGRYEKTIPAGTHSFLLALHDVVGGIIGWIGNGRVAE
jgi:hypothetical protein